MSVWGGLIARDVTEMATDGDAEDVAISVTSRALSLIHI